MPETVYRSNHSTVAEAMAEYALLHDQFSASVKAFLAELGPEMAGRNVHVALGFKFTHVVGLTSIDADGPAPPEGWRIEQRGPDRILVPVRKTKEGKALAKRMTAITLPNPFTLLPGMPTDYFPALHGSREYGNKVFNPGLWTYDGYVWVTWACRLPLDAVDRTLWEPVPLSWYYAAYESYEASRADAGV